MPLVSARLLKRNLIRSRPGTPFKTSRRQTENSLTELPIQKKKIRKASKRKQRNNEHTSFTRYLHHILQASNRSVSVKAMAVLDNFCLDIFKKIADEASVLLKHSNKLTLQQSDIESALHLLFPGNLCDMLISKGAKALIKYENSLKEHKQMHVTFKSDTDIVCYCPL